MSDGGRSRSHLANKLLVFFPSAMLPMFSLTNRHTTACAHTHKIMKGQKNMAEFLKFTLEALQRAEEKFNLAWINLTLLIFLPLLVYWISPRAKWSTQTKKSTTLSLILFDVETLLHGRWLHLWPIITVGINDVTQMCSYRTWYDTTINLN